MATDPDFLWRWQAGTAEDELTVAVDIADDGTVILAGNTRGNWTGTNAGQEDFAAVKLSADGVEEWRWQEGTDRWEAINDVVIGEDGSAFLVGYSDGNWSGINAGDDDFTVAKISSNGTTLWRWQDGTLWLDILYSVALRPDGSVLSVGATNGDWNGEALESTDFAAVILDADGDELWRWANGTNSTDYALDVELAEDNSAILCGYTYGSFGELNAGLSDMVVIKLSSDGDFLWAWQNGTSTADVAVECALGSDGSIYLAGYTGGNWSDVNFGGQDFAAAKLDAGGNEIWRWQEGTPVTDIILTVAVTADGSLFLAGYTFGDWASPATGNTDFAIARLHPNSTILWRWQDGNSDFNWIAVAASSADKIIFGANTNGDWEETGAGETDFAAILLESTGSDNSSNPTSSPAYSETFSPALSPSDSPILTSSLSTPGPSPAPSSLHVPEPSPSPPSAQTRTPTPISLSTPSPNIIIPTQSGTTTPAPLGRGITGSTGSPLSPLSSSTSSSSTRIAIISGVTGVVVGIVITGLIVVLLGKRRARRSTPEPESAPRRRNIPPSQLATPPPPPPDYRTAVSRGPS